MKQKTGQWIFSLLLHLSVPVLALIGVMGSWQKHGISMLQYYTVDSNLLGAIAFLVFALCLLRQRSTGQAPPLWARLLKYTSVCCLMVTFLVVILVLAPSTGMGGYGALLTKGDMLYHHLLCPLLALVSFLLFDEMPVKAPIAAGIALLPTVLYGVVTLVLNLTRRLNGPYPFLHVYEQPLWLSCLWFVVIVGGAFGLALLLARVKRPRSPICPNSMPRYQG